MLVNAAQNPHQFGRPSHTMRQGSGSYHRRSHSSLAVAFAHEHYEHPSYHPTANSGRRYYDTVEITEESTATTTTAIATGDGAGSSASPNQTRRRAESLSMTQLQRSLSGANISNTAAATAFSSEDGVVSVATGSLGGKVKLNPAAPTPRRSLLSDMLQNQSAGPGGRLEQNANRRRMLKSMRRYSVDASEMNFNVLGPYTSPMQGIPAEGEETTTGNAAQTGFSDTPTVRYLRNPSHATVKTKLVQGGSRRGTEDGEARDYFGAEDRVW
ncbi:hypothetical protein BGZ83_000328 [Gryganskiella cystojenkinii]|nr:hypothetical protein BGZ83_000328 [Gryganskiella cystojenkinii]